LHHRVVVAVRSARRLVHDLVDEPERFQACCRDSERFGRVRREIGAFPEYGSAAFGRNDRIGRVLQHQRRVADGNRQRASGAAFADNRAHDRHAQIGHRIQVAADRFGLAALLGAYARVCARRIDEREHGNRELFGELHQTQRLTVALGLRHAEVAVDFLLGVAPFLVPDHHARLSVEACEPAHDRGVVGERAVAVQLLVTRENPVRIVERVRALWVTRHQRDLPRGELAVDVTRERLALALQPGDFFGDVERRIVLDVTQLFDFRFELGDRLLEIQKGGFHRGQ
jgi:hypothetical protein